jgi:hypothetical protein
MQTRVAATVDLEQVEISEGDTSTPSLHEVGSSITVTLREAEADAVTLRQLASVQADQIRRAAAEEAAALRERLEVRHTAARQTLNLELRAMDEDSAERRRAEEADLRLRVAAEVEAEVEAIMAAAADRAAHVVSDAERQAEEVISLAETLQDAARRWREVEAEAALAHAQSNATRQLLSQELQAMDDDAREEAAQAKEALRREHELAEAQVHHLTPYLLSRTSYPLHPTTYLSCASASPARRVSSCATSYVCSTRRLRQGARRPPPPTRKRPPLVSDRPS